MLRDNAMKKGGKEVEVKIHTFLIYTLKAFGRSASSFVTFTPIKSCPESNGYETVWASKPGSTSYRIVPPGIHSADSHHTG
jgi:hypothetical protein